MTAAATLSRPRPSLHNSVSAEEWQARVNLAAAHRFAHLKGLQEDYKITNHLTARVPGEPGYFLIKPHDLLYNEVRASDLLKVEIDGPPLNAEQHNVNAPGFAIHSAVFRARPDLNASFHVHSEIGMAISALEGGLKFFTQEAMRFYGRLAYHDWEGFAEIDEGPHLVRDLGKQKNMILRNHGVLCCGDTIEQAAINLASLIRVADTQLRLMATGGKIIEPSREICEEAAKQYERPGRNKTEWAAVLRYIDRHDSSYRE